MEHKDYFTIVGITSKNISGLQEAAKNPVFTIDLLANGDFSSQDGFYATDPFVFSHNDRTHIFCEVLTATNKGFIGKYIYNPETGTVSSPKLLLSWNE